MQISETIVLSALAIISGSISFLPILAKQKIGENTLKQLVVAHSKNAILISRVLTLGLVIYLLVYLFFSIFPRECKAKYAIGTLQIGKIYKPKESLDEVKVEPSYGIQVFSGDDVCRTLAVAEDFKDSPYGEPLIKVKIVNNLKRYALLIGKFHKRETAQNIRELVSKYYAGKLEYVKDPFLETYDEEDWKNQQVRKGN